MTIELQQVSHHVPHNGVPLPVLEDISLTIETGELLCLLGPSGCGKSTLLNAVAGFHRLTGGRILMDGKEVREPSPRRIILFQQYGLLPWRSVQRNVELGLEPLRLSAAERRETAFKFLCMVGLEAFADNRPTELSGGMQQRVALARALAVNPEVLLMDEPLGALDAITRLRMQSEIRKIWQSCRPTVILVTHSIEEAVFLADRIVIMTPRPGRISTVLPVTMPHPRDRLSQEFQALRDIIYTQLGF